MPSAIAMPATYVPTTNAPLWSARTPAIVAAESLALVGGPGRNSATVSTATNAMPLAALRRPYPRSAIAASHRSGYVLGIVHTEWYVRAGPSFAARRPPLRGTRHRARAAARGGRARVRRARLPRRVGRSRGGRRRGDQRRGLLELRQQGGALL